LFTFNFVAVQKEGWEADPQTRFITPKKPSKYCGNVNFVGVGGRV